MTLQQRICLQCRRCRFDPWVRKIPWRRAWQPTPVFLPGESMNRRAWQATVHGVSKSCIPLNRLNTHTHTHLFLNKCLFIYLAAPVGARGILLQYEGSSSLIRIEPRSLALGTKSLTLLDHSGSPRNTLHVNFLPCLLF